MVENGGIYLLFKKIKKIEKWKTYPENDWFGREKVRRKEVLWNNPNRKMKQKRGHLLDGEDVKESDRWLGDLNTTRGL